MIDTIFQGVFENTGSGVELSGFLICTLSALVLGLVLCLVYSRKNRASQSFTLSLALLPAIVCVVIMMVNGNVGAGVAVAGAFSLVRFRSQPGSAKEIAMLFLAMGCGLILGMGYVGYAVLFTLILCLAFFLLESLGIKGAGKASQEKTLRITIPEDLDYDSLFDDLFDQYTEQWENVSVKTTNMGSMFKLVYHITLKDKTKEKEFIDQLRCRNGNLEISIAHKEEIANEL